MKTLNLRKAVVLITVALTGIGRATALEFACQQAKLFVLGRREEAGRAHEKLRALEKLKVSRRLRQWTRRLSEYGSLQSLLAPCKRRSSAAWLVMIRA
jgi:NAD(P)-dependent dehydrogenase (short-subunit alcohol dehydrogenase family)